MISTLYPPFRKWSETGTIWIYSDPHFGDKDLEKGITSRPTTEEQIKMINSKVGKHDTLIILGDVGDISAVSKLKGYKILIKGNHDIGSSNYQELFDEVYEGPVFIAEKIILSHEPLNITCALNIHGHIHDKQHQNDMYHLNVCSDIINYTPINFNRLLKTGVLKKIESIHRITINSATAKKRGRYNDIYHK